MFNYIFALVSFQKKTVKLCEQVLLDQIVFVVVRTLGRSTNSET